MQTLRELAAVLCDRESGTASSTVGGAVASRIRRAAPTPHTPKAQAEHARQLLNAPRGAAFALLPFTAVDHVLQETAAGELLFEGPLSFERGAWSICSKGITFHLASFLLGFFAFIFSLTNVYFIYV